MEVTADANIYISALEFGGVPLRFIDAARANIFRIAISDPLLAEVHRVLRVKFRWSDEALDEALAGIADFTRHVRPAMTIDVVEADPDDNRVLECAMEARSEFIVTGDNDLLRLGGYAAIRIIRVADFMNLIDRSG